MQHLGVSGDSACNGNKNMLTKVDGQVTNLSKGSDVKLLEVMNGLFDKLHRWEKEWGAGMKWIDS